MDKDGPSACRAPFITCLLRDRWSMIVTVTLSNKCTTEIPWLGFKWGSCFCVDVGNPLKKWLKEKFKSVTSGASKPNSMTAFSSTTEVYEDLF